MQFGEIKAISSSTGGPYFPLFFGDWLKQRRKELDLTQRELAEHASCSVFTLRKIEAGERRPSKQLARLLVSALEIPSEDHTTFIRVARGELNIERLQSIAAKQVTAQVAEISDAPPLIHLPFQSTPLIGREAELEALAKLLREPHCRLLTITGLGGIGKTRLSIELAASQKNLFPGGIYYVALDSLSSPEFIVPAIAGVFGLSFSGVAEPQEQLLSHLAALTDQAFLIVLDNLEHLMVQSLGTEGKDETCLLITMLLQRVPNLKILTTSRERSNLQEEWVFDLHGLPVPAGDQTKGLEDFSAAALFLQRARQQRADFELLPNEQPLLARICQLVEGTPLALELAASWVGMLSMEEIAQEIATNLDFLTNPRRNVPERHRSLRAVFTHSWNLLSDEERSVLNRLSVFRGGFQRQAAERIAGMTLPVLMALLSKSLVSHREDNRYDLHALIRQCALEKLQASGHYEETCNQHLAYFARFALEAQDGLRSAQLAEWLKLIERELNNIRAALEWAFSPSAPTERVQTGIWLVNSIDRFWAARGYIQEGIAWIERGLRLCTAPCLARAKALWFAGWLYNHVEDNLLAISYLEESLTISRQLNDDAVQASVLDTLADIGWRYGDFEKARMLYSQSLGLYQKGGDARKIGLSLASSGRLHVDCGHYQEAEALLTEGLELLESVSDLRGCGWCYNALARLAFFQGQVELAGKQFRQALRVNNELGYLIDIADGLRSLSIISAVEGDISRGTVLLAAATNIQKRIGFTYDADNDAMRQHAPTSWTQIDITSQAWKEGEMMALDEAVAYALRDEIE